MPVTIITMALRVPWPPPSPAPPIIDSLCLLNLAKKPLKTNSGFLEWDFRPCLEMCKISGARSGEWRKSRGRVWVPGDSCRQQIRAGVSHNRSWASRAELRQVCAREIKRN